MSLLFPLLFLHGVRKEGDTAFSTWRPKLRTVPLFFSMLLINHSGPVVWLYRGNNVRGCGDHACTNTYTLGAFLQCEVLIIIECDSRAHVLLRWKWILNVKYIAPLYSVLWKLVMIICPCTYLTTCVPEKADCLNIPAFKVHTEKHHWQQLAAGLKWSFD